jgi:hypothetical protein
MAEAQARALLAGDCECGLDARAHIDAMTSGTLVEKVNCKMPS